MAAAKTDGKESKMSIVDDFMYGSNVATAHVYVRMGFLRKVYGILSVQLLATTLTAGFFLLNDSMKSFVQKSSWMLLVAFIGTIGVLFALMWKRRETPINFILLGVFTLLEAYTVGVVVTFYSVSSVLEAFGLTLAVTSALTLYTFQSKRDFSSWGAGLFACLWVLLLAGFMQVIFPSALMDKALAVGGAILFSGFIVFDTHMIMHRLSPEEYIVASVDLYLDILNLFLHLLRLLGDRQ